MSAELVMGQSNVDWIMWEPRQGAECPVHPDDLVEIGLRNGYSFVEREANQRCWDDTPNPGSQIVAYRIVKPRKPSDLRVTSPVTAASILDAAAGHMRDRAATYDKPEGERSMARAVQAFNAITGHDLTTAEGWEFMAVLKQVRVFQNPDKPHRDSLEDLTAYSALLAEEMLGGAQ